MHRRSSTLLLVFMFAALVVVVTVGSRGVSAQGRTQSARSQGLAGAFTANSSGNGALYTNPAGIGTSLTYTFEGQYLYEPGLNTFNGSIVDSKINPVLAMGAAYSYEDTTGDGELSGHDARLAVAHQVVPQRLVVGLGGRYLRYSDGETRVLDGFTLDAGVIVRAADGFFLGVSGNNLLDVCDGDATCLTEGAPRSVSGGLALGSSFGLQVTGDVRANLPNLDDVSWEYAGGVEFLAAQILALRAGYRWLGASESSVVAGGLGFRSSAAGLDLAYMHNLDSGEHQFSVGLQLYFLTGSDAIRYTQR